MPLNIFIIGGGITGLAVAVGLARHGHQITVYERRLPGSEGQSGSGIQLQPNVNRILETWGMMEELKKVAHDNEICDLRRADGSSIVKADLRPAGAVYYILRRVCKDLFKQFARNAGVEVLEGVNVVDMDANLPAVVLEGGSKVEADLVIGADGSGSKVRRLLFPSYKPAVLPQTCWQVILPLGKVRSDPVLRTLLDEHHNLVTLSPGRSVFTSPVPRQDQVDLQFTDHEYTLEQDPNPNHANEHVSDLTCLRNRFSDHDAGTRKALQLATSAFKWRFTEVIEGLPAWTSSSGKVVLLGDACHSMPPYSGQGTALGIEDAAVLSELLADVSPGDDLRPRLKLYEELRRSRCERIRKYAKAIGRTRSEKDPQKIAMRDRLWQKTLIWKHAGATADGNASFGSPEFQEWMEHYDVFEAVRAELSKSKGARPRL
ncbi:FAD-dependent monooxygenase OpS4 [Pseudocercospora fuligena]|uniref:FAD-dependent monooxygenase OpS4 n=1 Tax=Pseudocercospora fuligena TaxID=685502 RepID=A0A8H6VHM9_9PEZI|nr:FAD-dependent monooxygenase OpS4 [Pseudocercospora fuligena]